MIDDTCIRSGLERIRLIFDSIEFDTILLFEEFSLCFLGIPDIVHMLTHGVPDLKEQLLSFGPYCSELFEAIVNPLKIFGIDQLSAVDPSQALLVRLYLEINGQSILEKRMKPTLVLSASISSFKP